MQLTEKELRQAYRQATSRPGYDRRSCFGAEQLVVLVRGALSRESLPQARAHMARCSDCSRELLLLRALGEWALETTELPSRSSRLSSRPRAGEPSRLASLARALASLWRDATILQRLLAVGLPLLVLALVTSSLLLFARASRLQSQLAATPAAGGDAAAVSQSLEQATSQLGELEQERDRLEQEIEGLQAKIESLQAPIPNPVMVTLDLRDVERRGETLARQTVTLPSGTDWFLLSVTLPAESLPPSTKGARDRKRSDEAAEAAARAYDDYALEIYDQRSETVWETAGLELVDESTFRLWLPTLLLSRGIFHLRFFGSRGGEKELLEQVSIVMSVE